MKYFQKLLIIIWLPFLCHSKLLSSETAIKNSKVKSFLQALLNTNHPECTLLFFQDFNDNSDILTHLVQNTNYMNYFNVKYSYRESDEESISNEAFLNKTLVEQIKYYTDKVPVIFPITVSNYHKRSDQCVVSIMMIEDLRPKFMSNIYNVLTPVYIPITRKDLDYYVFVTKPDLMESLMLMNELPARIKFKIAVGENTKQNQLVVKSMCFFCGQNGSPVPLNYPLEFRQDWNYFPDMVRKLNGKLLRISSAYIRGRIEVDPPWEGINNARRGVVKHCLEEYLMVLDQACIGNTNLFD